MTLKDIRNFVEGTFLHTLHTAVNLESATKEQATYRCLICWACYKNKRCTECGCSTPAMFFAPNKVDSKKLWAKMFDSVQWNLFKTSKTFEENLTAAYGSYKKDPEFIALFASQFGELLSRLEPSGRERGDISARSSDDIPSNGSSGTQYSDSGNSRPDSSNQDAQTNSSSAN